MQIDVPDLLVPYLKLAIVRAQIATDHRAEKFGANNPEVARFLVAQGREFDRLAVAIGLQTPRVELPASWPVPGDQAA